MRSEIEKILSELVNEVEWCVNPAAGAVAVNREKEQAAQNAAQQALVALFEKMCNEECTRRFNNRTYTFPKPTNPLTITLKTKLGE